MKEWTGIDFASSTRAAETGQGGKVLLVPRRSSNDMG